MTSTHAHQPPERTEPAGARRRGRPRVRPDAGGFPPEFARLLRAFLTYVRVECGLSANTAAAYQRDCEDLFFSLRASGRTELAQVTARDLSDHLAALRSSKGMAASSVVRHLATIRSFFKWAMSTGLISENPADLLDRPKPWKKLPRVMSPRQVKSLIEAPPAGASAGATGDGASSADGADGAPGLTVRDALDLRDRAMLELMYACGTRASEVADLRVEDVHFDLGVVRITGKGEKTRLVPIGKPARSAIRRYLELARPVLAGRGNARRAGGAGTPSRPDNRGEGRLLLSRTGRPLERVAVWQLVRKRALAAGLPAVHPHMLRHSFATHLLFGGANLKVVQQLLGHADVATTQIYTHVDAHRLREIHQRFHPRK